MENQIFEFLAALDAMKKAYNAKMGYAEETHGVTFRAEMGKKYARIVECRGKELYGSAFCFVDLATGDILKSASWKAPAKGVRGNIRNGAADVGPYGARYLR